MMGRVLTYASDDLRADPAIVLYAVAAVSVGTGARLRGAALALLADRTVVHAAVLQRCVPHVSVMRRMNYARIARLCWMRWS